MHGTQQIWNLVWQEGPYDNHTTPRTNPHPQKGFEIDPRLGAATLRAPAASREESKSKVTLDVIVKWLQKWLQSDFALLLIDFCRFKLDFKWH